MIFLLIRSSLPLYGLPLMIASERAAPICGNASSSALVAELMSTKAALGAVAAGAILAAGAAVAGAGLGAGAGVCAMTGAAMNADRAKATMSCERRIKHYLLV